MGSLIASIRIVVATMLICVAGYAAVIWGVGPDLDALHRAGIADYGRGRKSHRQPSDRAELHAAALFLAAARRRPARTAMTRLPPQAATNRRPATTLPKRAKEIDCPLWRHRRRIRCLPNWRQRRAAAWTRISASTRPSIRRRGLLEARGLSASSGRAVIRQNVFAPGGFLTPDRLVNVLELNLALDRLAAAK